MVTETMYVFHNTPTSYFDNETFHNMILETDVYYWLASRAVTVESYYDNITFRLRMVQDFFLGGVGLFYENGMSNYNDWSIYLRPVVTLGSEYTVDTTSGSGSADSMYVLKKTK